MVRRQCVRPRRSAVTRPIVLSAGGGYITRSCDPERSLTAVGRVQPVWTSGADVHQTQRVAGSS